MDLQQVRAVEAMESECSCRLMKCSDAQAVETHADWFAPLVEPVCSKFAGMKQSSHEVKQPWSKVAMKKGSHEVKQQ